MFTQLMALLAVLDALDKSAWFGAGAVVGFVVGFVLAGVYFKRKQCEIAGQ